MVYSFLKFLPEGKTLSKEKNRKYNSQRERQREKSALRLDCLSLVYLSQKRTKRKTKPEEWETDRKRKSTSFSHKNRATQTGSTTKQQHVAAHSSVQSWHCWLQVSWPLTCPLPTTTSHSPDSWKPSRQTSPASQELRPHQPITDTAHS